MPLPHQKFREAVLQILYSLDFESSDEIIPLMMGELKATRSAVRSARDKADQILKERSNLNSIIQEVSTEYRLERISKVEMAILQSSLFELLFEETPIQIVIAEAIRLARKFGTPESAQFINAILDGAKKSDAFEAAKGALPL